MRRLIIPTLAALTLLGAGLLLPNRADAVPLSAPGSLAAAIADNAIVQETRWRRWGWRRHWRWRYSDVDLKQDVVQVGKLDNGIGLYRFSYKGDDHTAYVRVMAQEVQTVMPTAVARGRNGYLLVNYDRLGFQMMTWEQWLAQTGVRQPVQ
jgi:hypothetical protein